MGKTEQSLCTSSVSAQHNISGLPFAAAQQIAVEMLFLEPIWFCLGDVNGVAGNEQKRASTISILEQWLAQLVGMCQALTFDSSTMAGRSVRCELPSVRASTQEKHSARQQAQTLREWSAPTTSVRTWCSAPQASPHPTSPALQKNRLNVQTKSSHISAKKPACVLHSISSSLCDKNTGRAAWKEHSTTGRARACIGASSALQAGTTWICCSSASADVMERIPRDASAAKLFQIIQFCIRNIPHGVKCLFGVLHLSFRTMSRKCQFHWPRCDRETKPATSFDIAQQGVHALPHGRKELTDRSTFLCPGLAYPDDGLLWTEPGVCGELEAVLPEHRDNC